MAKKPKTIYVCQSCGHEHPRWSGRCPQCGEWNTFVETVVSRSPPTSAKLWRGRKPPNKLKSLTLSEVTSHASSRLSTGIGEFDRVLGGPSVHSEFTASCSGQAGIVPGSAILLAGEPGIGKSTLLLQVAAGVVPSALYVSGEESPSQIKLRADRLGLKSNIQILSETNVDALVSSLAHPATPVLPSLIIIDSVQTLTTEDLSAGAGTISQVRECSQRLIQLAKSKDMPLILAGHVIKGGAIAGPKVLEHMVDVVLYLEGDKFHKFRLLRSHKNRYGSDQEVGVFEMGDRGLSEVANPSDNFLSERLKNTPGSVVTATMEGTRPVLVEIQALVSSTSLSHPRRTTSGFSYNRLLTIIAVLQKRTKINLQNKDIYVNVAGGFKVSEPAADLACALAIVSSVKDKPVEPQTCVFGEVGLSGEVRKVSQSERRAKEAKKLGFKKIISPEKARSVGEAVSQA